MLPVCASRKGNLILFSNAIRVLKDAEFSTASRYVESCRRLKKKKITLMLPNKDRKTNYCCNFSTIGRFTTIPDAAITPISLFLEEGTRNGIVECCCLTSGTALPEKTFGFFDPVFHSSQSRPPSKSSNQPSSGCTRSVGLLPN